MTALMENMVNLRKFGFLVAFFYKKAIISIVRDSTI